MKVFSLLILLFFVSACQVDTDTENGSKLKTPVIWNGVWELTEISNRPVLSPEKWLEEESVTFISLEQSGAGTITLKGYSGCNSFGRTIETGQIKAEQFVMSTQRGCGKSMAVQEKQLYEILSGNPKFSFDGDNMTMQVVAENGNVLRGKYTRKVWPSILGSWKVTKLNDSSIKTRTDMPEILVDITKDVIAASSQCIPFRWEYTIIEDAFNTTVAPMLDKKGNIMPICTRGLTYEEQLFSEIINNSIAYKFNHKGNPVILSETGSVVMEKR